MHALLVGALLLGLIVVPTGSALALHGNCHDLDGDEHLTLDELPLSTVLGIFQHGDHAGPLHPPGFSHADALILYEVVEALASFVYDQAAAGNPLLGIAVNTGPYLFAKILNTTQAAAGAALSECKGNFHDDLLERTEERLDVLLSKLALVEDLSLLLSHLQVEEGLAATTPLPAFHVLPFPVPDPPDGTAAGDDDPPRGPVGLIDHPDHGVRAVAERAYVELIGAGQPVSAAAADYLEQGRRYLTSDPPRLKDAYRAYRRAYQLTVQ